MISPRTKVAEGYSSEMKVILVKCYIHTAHKDIRLQRILHMCPDRQIEAQFLKGPSSVSHAALDCVSNFSKRLILAAE